MLQREPSPPSPDALAPVCAAHGCPPKWYVPVGLDGLVADTCLSFAVHRETLPRHFIVLLAEGRELTATILSRLRAAGVQTLYVTVEDRPQYEDYLARHLTTLLSVKREPEKRASLLYSATRTTLASVLGDHRHTDAAMRTRDVARELAGWLARDPDALGHLGALMAADYDTVRHSINVAVFATGLAVAAGVADPHDLQDFTHGALLHDVGKSRVPRELITKPGAYNEQELRLMRTHVVRGEHILRRDGRLSPIAMIPVAQHHERMDGEGYPRAIVARDLHPLGRIASICDVYDALTSHRSYKQAMTGQDALLLMSGKMASHFDQALLRTFIRTLRRPARQPSPRAA
jgi:HD-GYP domain-containing protein (c-di-GMP phosphodiesterase class II)